MLTNSTFLVRENMFGKEIVLGQTSFRFNNAKGKKSAKHVFIFAMVKKDAQVYLDKHKLQKSKWLPAVVENDIDITNKKIVGTDIDGAYWKIALQMGIIRERTFEKGLALPEKNICNAALASLGSDKGYRVVKDGIVTEDSKIVQGNDALKEVYKKIRYKCFYYMKKLAEILGDDFVCYKTDCIYYLRTRENIRKVKAFLELHKLDYKMAEEYTGTNILP